MENKFFVKKDGVISISHSQTVNDKILDKDCHLCGRCHNAEPKMCNKVADVHKKSLTDYDFITKGYQSFDENGESDILIVEKCEDYVPMSDFGKTKKQLAEYKKLKRQIACAYFDTATPEEAYLLQVEMFERGHLDINEKYLPNEKTVQLMKQRIQK